MYSSHTITLQISMRMDVIFKNIGRHMSYHLKFVANKLQTLSQSVKVENNRHNAVIKIEKHDDMNQGHTFNVKNNTEIIITEL